MCRRFFTCLALLAWIAGVAPVVAQQTLEFGKTVGVKANTPEDKALTEINDTTDPAKKLALIEKFVADFAATDHVIIGYEMLIAHYQSEKNPAKVLEYCDKFLAADPNSFSTALIAFRIAQEQSDANKLFAYDAIIQGILARFKERPAPEGADADEWNQRKAATLESVKNEVSYVEYTLFVTASQQRDPAARAAMLERFLKVYPDSAYAANALSLVAASYQMTRQYPKMLEFAQSVLTRDANNLGMLLLLADYWSESGQELNKAEANARKALTLFGAAQRPDNIPEAQWKQQVDLQKGIAYSALGQVQINKKQPAQAVESFRAASPLLKSDTVNYGRNLYRLGYTLAVMKRFPEARTILSEAVSLDTPYKSLAQQTLTQIGGASGTARPPAKKRP